MYDPHEDTLKNGLQIERQHFRWFFVGSIVLCLGILGLFVFFNFFPNNRIAVFLIGESEQNSDLTTYIPPTILGGVTLLTCIRLETKTAFNTYKIVLLKKAQERGDSVKELADAIETTTGSWLKRKKS